jgi:uncharacterized Zn-binding protein involved in type VI secretion
VTRICRLNDTHSHGGNITTASDDCFLDTIPVARHGDTIYCDIHGEQTIVGTPNTIFIDGKEVALDGDICTCGATLIASFDGISTG